MKQFEPSHSKQGKTDLYYLTNDHSDIVCLTLVNDGSTLIEIDVMPTIGREDYDSIDRVPMRHERGTLQEDALRRDLTVGAMYIHVTKCGGEDSSSSAPVDAYGMRYTLKDYHGGLQDLQDRVLRSPHPEKVSSSDLNELILSRHDDPTFATAMGLDLHDPLQMWWIKVLRDDPLRILRILRLVICVLSLSLSLSGTCRHLFSSMKSNLCSIALSLSRFAAKLDFTVHDVFWKVLPFALDDLRKKVSTLDIFVCLWG